MKPWFNPCTTYAGQWHLLVISAFRGEENDQRFKVILRLQRKFKNTKGLVHPQPPKKGQQLPVLLPLLRHIYLVSSAWVTCRKERPIYRKPKGAAPRNACLPAFQGRLRNHTKA